MRVRGHICVEGRRGRYDGGVDGCFDGLRILVVLRHLDELRRVLKKEHSGIRREGGVRQ